MFFLAKSFLYKNIAVISTDAFNNTADINELKKSNREECFQEAYERIAIFTVLNRKTAMLNYHI